MTSPNRLAWLKRLPHRPRPKCLAHLARQTRAGLTGLTWLAALWGAPAAQADTPDAQDLLGLAGGVMGAIAVHEAGHAALALAVGAQDVRIRVPGSQCRLLCGQTRYTLTRRLSPLEGQAVTAAGFAASTLATQWVLSSDRAARSGLGQGVVATHLYSNVAHVWRYYTQVVGVDGYRGNDIDHFAAHGGNPHLLSALLLGHAVYTLDRLRRREVPLLWVQLRF